MITHLAADALTERSWNAYDNAGHHYFGRIPLKPSVITLLLTCRTTRDGRPAFAAALQLDLARLAATGLVRQKAEHYLLRFQRAGERIEISMGRRRREKVEIFSANDPKGGAKVP